MIKQHNHDWSEWQDDTKPLNIQSQDKLILLSIRQCLDEDCEAMQPRIGRLNPPTQESTVKR